MRSDGEPRVVDGEAAIGQKVALVARCIVYDACLRPHNSLVEKSLGAIPVRVVLSSTKQILNSFIHESSGSVVHPLALVAVPFVHGGGVNRSPEHEVVARRYLDVGAGFRTLCWLKFCSYRSRHT